MNEVGGVRVSRRKGFGEVEVKLGDPIRRYQVYSWCIVIHLFPEG